ncbi:hypothetical protein [Rhizobium sp. BK376]|uniref:hypothetical protein n=1 Tax=Rhizobium sp. BK376 TaxID=2512149 RepID=UPI0010474327|nr:hypothetical protein [Rhizobium sp. BK376]TCR93379.1 hypothetical protein EV561_101825 [Rhizobium sp. BK376]
MSDQKTRESRSPPRDKLLSLDRDGRNDYGENSKSSRKNIPLFKAQSNRRGRHAAKVAANAMGDEDAIESDRRLSLADQKALRPAKTKAPDVPLREVLKRQGKLPKR